MMTKEESTKIVNCARVFRGGGYGGALIYVIILMMCTLIAVVLTGCNAAFLSYWFFLFIL